MKYPKDLKENNMKEENITITLKEYKELLELKGRYEELKEHPEIRYIYVSAPVYTPPQYPKITY